MKDTKPKTNSENSKSDMRRRFIKDVAIRRFLTMTGVTISISFVLAVLIQMLFYIRYEAIILLTVGIVVLLINAVRFNRWFYLSVAGDNIYYKIIFIVHLIFASVNIFCYLLTPNIVYSWFFLLPKFLKFIIPGSSDIASIAAFHGMFVLIALTSPLSVKWIVTENKTNQKIKMLEIDDTSKDETK